VKKLLPRTDHKQPIRTGSISQSGTNRGGYLPVMQYQRTDSLPLAEGIRWDPDGKSAQGEGTVERESSAEEVGGRAFTGQLDLAGDSRETDQRGQAQASSGARPGNVSGI